MLTTSQAYKNAMMKPEVRARVEVTISDGTNTVTVTDRDILRESFTINWRASNNQTFSLGTCYAAGFNFTAFKRMSTAVEGDYLTITPRIFYQIGNNQEEELPLGVYRCDTPTAYAKTTAYECYDYMLALDKRVTDRTGATAYYLLDYICDECGVVFGNTFQQIAAMINSGVTLYLDPKQVGTYRDAVSYIAIILGGYAIFGRDGRLYIRQFHKTSDRELSRKRRTSSSFAAYKTYFQGVKCRFLADQNFYTYESYSETREDGIILDLGDIPIIEGNPTLKQSIIDNIFSEIEDVEYTPATISMVGDPSIEPGDCIETKDRDGYTKTIILTSVTFSLRKECEILSEGSNPKLDKVTTAEKKNQQRQEQATANSTVVTATYENASEIIFDDTDPEEITNLRFATNKEITAIFGATVPVYSDGYGYINITYNDTGVPIDTLKAWVHPGYNVLTFVDTLHFETGRIVFLTLTATTEGISGAAAPAVTIAQNTVRSYIFAQGIEIEAPWDGIITISEAIEAVAAIIQATGLTESAELKTLQDEGASVSEQIEAIIASVQEIALHDTINLTVEYIDAVNHCGEDYRAGTDGVLL